MRSFVYIESGFLRESLEAYVTLVGALSRVRAVVDLQVLLAREGGRALQALERAALHCGRIQTSVRSRRRATSPRARINTSSPHNVHTSLSGRRTLGLRT